MAIGRVGTGIRLANLDQVLPVGFLGNLPPVPQGILGFGVFPAEILELRCAEWISTMSCLRIASMDARGMFAFCQQRHSVASAQPGVSSTNFLAGRVLANSVIAPTAFGGSIRCLRPRLQRYRSDRRQQRLLRPDGGQRRLVPLPGHPMPL